MISRELDALVIPFYRVLNGWWSWVEDLKNKKIHVELKLSIKMMSNIKHYNKIYRYRGIASRCGYGTLGLRETTRLSLFFIDIFRNRDLNSVKIFYRSANQNLAAHQALDHIKVRS